MLHGGATYVIAHAQFAVIWGIQMEPTYLPHGSFATKNPSAALQVLVVVQVFELELEVEEEVHFMSSTYTFMIKNAVD